MRQMPWLGHINARMGMSCIEHSAPAAPLLLQLRSIHVDMYLMGLSVPAPLGGVLFGTRYTFMDHKSPGEAKKNFSFNP